MTKKEILKVLEKNVDIWASIGQFLQDLHDEDNEVDYTVFDWHYENAKDRRDNFKDYYPEFVEYGFENTLMPKVYMIINNRRIDIDIDNEPYEVRK